MDPERLRRIRNWQSSEFYARLVMRPLTILIMLGVGDWRILTPNRATTLANLAKLIGAGLIVLDHREHAIGAALWLQAGLLLDHLDGTLARYRGTSSSLGAFYDKVSDAITWVAITGAVGWAAYKDTGDVALPIAALGSAYALLTIGYMRWVVASAGALPPRIISPDMTPPTRTGAEWARWFGSSLLRIVLFEEVDLFFWIGLGLVLGKLEWLIWLLAFTQAIQLAIMVIKRALQVHALDVARRAA
jgi:phosphatidylglycerophosphate synthase